MFKLELISLLNNYSKTSDKNEQEKIKSSIKRLIRDHQNEFETFKNSGTLDQNKEQLLDQIIESFSIQDNEDETDFEKVKNTYYTWARYYEANNFEINEQSSKIVEDMINFYGKRRFPVLKKLLEIDETDDKFIAFKNFLSNKLRLYFVLLVKEYKKSDKYTSLKFFSKMKKDKQIIKFYNKLNKYEFDIDLFYEVIEEWVY